MTERGRHSILTPPCEKRCLVPLLLLLVCGCDDDDDDRRPLEFGNVCEIPVSQKIDSLWPCVRAAKTRSIPYTEKEKRLLKNSDTLLFASATTLLLIPQA